MFVSLFVEHQPKKRNIRWNPRLPQCVLCSVLVQVNSFKPWSVVTCLCDNRFQGFLNYWPLWGNIYLGHLHPSDAIHPEEKLQSENKRTHWISWLIRSMFAKKVNPNCNLAICRKDPTKVGRNRTRKMLNFYYIGYFLKTSPKQFGPTKRKGRFSQLGKNDPIKIWSPSHSPNNSPSLLEMFTFFGSWKQMDGLGPAKTENHPRPWKIKFTSHQAGGRKIHWKLFQPSYGTQKNRESL